MITGAVSNKHLLLKKKNLIKDIVKELHSAVCFSLMP